MGLVEGNTQLNLWVYDIFLHGWIYGYQWRRFFLHCVSLRKQKLILLVFLTPLEERNPRENLHANFYCKVTGEIQSLLVVALVEFIDPREPDMANKEKEASL
ncbi:hypothetical protein RYX36_015860 [Vicia faba]